METLLLIVFAYCIFKQRLKKKFKNLFNMDLFLLRFRDKTLLFINFILLALVIDIKKDSIALDVYVLYVIKLKPLSYANKLNKTG